MSFEWSWEHRIGRYSRRPIATYTLIAINTFIYLASSAQNVFTKISNEWVDSYAYIPILMYNPAQWYRIITSMFLHGDIFHIFFNMMFLYWFGREIEQLLGLKRFIILYIISGIAATIFHTGFTPIMGSLNLIIPALGASGAISGLLGAYLLVYPRRRLSICWFLYFVPVCFTTLAIFFLLFWFATQVIYGYLRFGGIAFFAHVGGFIAGLSLIYFLKRKKPLEELHHIIIPFEIRRPEGIGSTAKTALFLLLLAVLGGALYSTVLARQATNVYIIDITACVASTCVKDQGVYTPIGGEYIAPSRDIPRIAFNRLIWSGVIRSTPGYSGSIVVTPRTITAPDYGLRIYININGVGRYDENGVLIEFNGSIVTDIISVNIWGFAERGERIEINNVILTSQDIAKDADKVVIRPSALASSLITLSSMFIVVFKDREVVEEETIFPPTYAPWI